MAAGEALGFAGAVGDVEDGDAGFVMDVLEEAAHFIVEFFVERAERFVEAQDGRAMRKGATECDALGLTATELVRRAVEEMADSQQLGEFINAIGDLGLRLFTENGKPRNGWLVAMVLCAPSRSREPQKKKPGRF